MSDKSLRPSEQYVEKVCILCQKPIMVKLKEVKSRWGNDFKHRECYLSKAKLWRERI